MGETDGGNEDWKSDATISRSSIEQTPISEQKAIIAIAFGVVGSMPRLHSVLWLHSSVRGYTLGCTPNPPPYGYTRQSVQLCPLEFLGVGVSVIAIKETSEFLFRLKWFLLPA